MTSFERDLLERLLISAVKYLISLRLRDSQDIPTADLDEGVTAAHALKDFATFIDMPPVARQIAYQHLNGLFSLIEKCVQI